MIQDYGFRLYNPAIAKFLSVDPLAPQFPFYTPYQFAGNGPIINIDLDGLEPHNVTAEDGSVIKSSVEEKNVATVNSGVSNDQTSERYGYNGSYEQYQKDYPEFQNIPHSNAGQYHGQVHGENFDNQVNQLDKEERERIATEKLLGFMTWFPMMATTVAPGGGVIKPVLPRTTGKSFSSGTSNILTTQKIIDNPKNIWGRSVNEIDKALKADGLKTTIRNSTRGSRKATIIEVKGMKGSNTISQIQVHPGGGRHGGAYFKISTNEGIRKVVNGRTYRGGQEKKTTKIFNVEYPSTSLR